MCQGDSRFEAAIRIKTSYDRLMGWNAIDDSTYDGPGSPIGFGATEQEAIDELLERIEERKS